LNEAKATARRIGLEVTPAVEWLAQAVMRQVKRVLDLTDFLVDAAVVRAAAQEHGPGFFGTALATSQRGTLRRQEDQKEEHRRRGAMTPNIQRHSVSPRCSRPIR